MGTASYSANSSDDMDGFLVRLQRKGDLFRDGLEDPRPWVE